ncbi:MAG: pentapeptide repeat-containing protein [Dolichospermum sp. WA123]|nr:pentapeptide repeat-containing protein [Dolichospermum sp. WA123]
MGRNIIYDKKLIERYREGHTDFGNYKIIGYTRDFDKTPPANLCNEDIRGINLNRSHLWLANLENVILENSTIRNAELFNIKLINSNLIGVDFSGSDLHQANLVGSDLRDSVLRCAILRSANLKNTNLSGADLSNSDLSYGHLENANLSGANLRGTILKGVQLENTDFSGADLTDAYLDYTCLKGMIIDNNTKMNQKYYLIWEITNKELENRNLSGQDLSKANLSGATLTKADLRGADLTEADLRRAKLECANLRGANFKSSKIAKANFAEANFCDTDLSQTHNKLTTVSTLKDAYYNDETKFPEGLHPTTVHKIPQKAAQKISQMIWSNYQDPQWIKELLNNKGEPHKYPSSREKQQEFKEEITKIYGYKCLISGCEIKEIIEAAHIIPYSKIESHDVANGLLLRVDLHRLFDAHLIAIHPTNREVLISEQIAKEYQDIRGIQIVSCLTGEDATKQQDTLRYHCEQCNWIDKQLLE